MLTNETAIREESLVCAAKQMAQAARTAPKGRGDDQLEILIVTGDEKTRLADTMAQIGQSRGLAGFTRDSENVRAAPVVLLIGTGTRPRKLKLCSLCGYPNCESLGQGPGGVCVFAISDLGIAVGSAVSIAADLRVDNRIMYSAAIAAIQCGFFTPEIKVAYAIPLSASGKSPFFDRG
ncbi:MAG: DUF2148 domain-containing protein [Spirochaetota bacterium]|jgi:uncharacterized ferredoxin-like protein|nr:DUF2148 domain-containing protein [Spirochaetota bacterium]